MRTQVLAEGGSCVLGAGREFQGAAAALEQSLTASPSPNALAAARTAFHSAMDAWQINELMLIGPTATSASPGGSDLRDQIYSWPLVSRCVIEEALVAKSYETNLGAQLINRRGLYALEYLLFYEGAATACPSTSTIVSGGSWAALSAGELAARRWAYAAAAATQVRVRADELVSRWETDFLGTLKSAGPANPVFKTEQAALNVLSDALFYVDAQMKDLKLAPAMGLRDCASPPCVELLESQFAARSKANLKANLEGFRRIYSGCGAAHEGTAFDDLLQPLGAGELATRVSSALDGIDAALAAIDEPDLAAALRADPASVRGLYDALKVLTDLMKTELITVLSLAIPQALEGDND